MSTLDWVAIIYFVVGLLLLVKWWIEEYSIQYEEAKRMEEEDGEQYIEYPMVFIFFVFVLFLWPIALLARALDIERW